MKNLHLPLQLQRTRTMLESWNMELEQSAGYPASVANLDDYFAWIIYFPVNTVLLPYSVGFSVVLIKVNV